MFDGKLGDDVNASIGLDWATRKAPTQMRWLGLPVALSALLFYLDLHGPERMVFGLPYLLVVILAQTIGGGRAATLAASSAATLVVAAPLLSAAAGDSVWMAVLGRSSVIAAMAMVVMVLRQRDAARAVVREQVDVLETSTSRRADELRLMNAQLHREIAERRRAELRSGYLASIVESSADAIIGQSLDGTIVSWNTGATRVYGHKREQIIGKPSSILLPCEHEEELLALLARVGHGEHVDEIESVRLRHDGTKFDVSASFSPILDEKGAIIGVSMIERDISPRVRAEEALQSLNAELEAKVHQRTEDLESAVGELEAFSYSVSHDLRAPLRALHGFTETLVEDAGERLSDDERELLVRIRRAADRMDRIIEDLLMLSRAGNHKIEKEVVNLGEIAGSVIDELRSASPQRQIDWDIGKGLLAWGDPGLLRLVMQNLVGNAFKYTARKDGARVSIGVDERTPESVTYYVRDNGIGFDPELACKLFRPFSRLHRSDQFEGSGIGLATVERILRRHGGGVSAEGRREEGATFRFRLPVPRRSGANLGEEIPPPETDGERAASRT